MSDLWTDEAIRNARRGADVNCCLYVTDEPSQLKAFIVLDNMALGPACGGVRVSEYLSPELAIEDCTALAKAMTIKCALADLAAGGGKAVVLDHPGLDRKRGFRQLGRHIEALGGWFRTSSDLGTTDTDLEAMAETTQYVHLNEGRLTRSAGRGIVLAAEACLRFRGIDSLFGLRVSVQGCGAIGSAAARAFREAGAIVAVSDLEPDRAAALAAEIGGSVLSPSEVLFEETDVLVPCARGGVIDARIAARIRTKVLCGGANNILADPESESILMERRIVWIPDVISSAGAVIEGVGETVMHLADRTPLLDGIQDTTHTVLARSVLTGDLPSKVALDLARARIDSASLA